jgi:hypothetical protein
VFRERFEDARKRLAHQLAHPRTADILAQLAAAARLFLLFAQEAGAIASPEAGNLHRRILAGLVEAASEQLIAQTATDPVETFFTLFGAVLASGRGHVASISGGKPETPSAYGWTRNDFGWSPQGDLIGWVGDDGHSLYLQMEAAYATCQELARRTGQNIEVGDRALRKRIDNKGLILSKEGGKEKRLTTRVLIDGVKTTVLHVRNPLTADEASVAAAEMPAATLIELRARSSAVSEDKVRSFDFERSKLRTQNMYLSQLLILSLPRPPQFPQFFEIPSSTFASRGVQTPAPPRSPPFHTHRSRSSGRLPSVQARRASGRHSGRDCRCRRHLPCSLRKHD